MQKQLTAEELQQIQELQTTSEQTLFALGKTVYLKSKVEQELSMLETKQAATEQKLNQLIDAITAKYGEGTVNVETGTITPKQ